MRASTKMFLLAVLLLTSVAAHAAPLYCAGSVAQLYSSVSGLLSFKAGYRGDYVAVCNLLSAYNGIQPELCKNWYATLLSAQVSGLPVTIHYPNTEGYASAAPFQPTAPPQRLDTSCLETGINSGVHIVTHISGHNR